MKKIKIKKVKVPKEKKPRKRRIKIWKILLLLFLLCCIFALAGAGFFLRYIVKNAPEFNPSALYDAQPTILYYQKNGEYVEYARLGSKLRTLVTFDELPQSLVDAIIATEDSRFFQHNGFDLPRFLKASFGQALGHDAGGASTLTMQISKNKITVKENKKEGGFKGIIRKFTDIYMAVFKIEKTYTKEEIIEFYVNSNYMGADTNGVEDASQVYFGKSVSDLNIAESAMLAGIFNAPSYYDPYINPDKCEQRRETVLYLLKRHGYITEEEYEIAMAMTVDKITKPKKETTENPYQDFIDMVTLEVQEKTKSDAYPNGLNPYEVAMKIYTTMDPDKQEHVTTIMNGTYSGYKWENDKVQAGVAVVSATDGSIVAVGGGRNRAILGTHRALYGNGTDNQYGISRQIGSTAKPLYDYAIGIEKLNWSTAQVFTDEPWGYTGGDEIKNWDLKYEGFVSMRTALVESRNIPALKAFQQIDVNKTKYDWVTSLGLHPELEGDKKVIHEAHATGGYNGESPLSLAGAYNAFATGGYYIEPYSVTKIEFYGDEEPIEFKYSMERVMSEETAWMMTNVLISVARGTGFVNYWVNGVTYAGKSGTTNYSNETIEERGWPKNAVPDLWAVGYTDKYTIATWYGYDKIADGYNKFGSGQNYRIFAAVANGVFKEKSNFQKPDGVVAIEIEKGCYEACLPSEFTPSDMRITEYFKKGYEPNVVSDRYAKLADVTNLKATVNDNEVTLTWDEITKPHAIDMDYLKAYMDNAYENDDYALSAAEERYNENMANLGSIVYNVYEQNGDKLTLVETTDKNTITIKPEVENPTYVVKVSYTVFKDNISDGTTVKVSGVRIKDLVVAIQNVKDITVENKDVKIKNEASIASVTVNGLDVPSNKVSYEYKLDNTKKAGDTYKLNVKVIYNKEVVDTFVINVTVTASTIIDNPVNPTDQTNQTNPDTNNTDQNKDTNSNE